MPDLTDLYAPPAPGSLMRSVQVMRAGLVRIARRDAEVYSVQIISAGSWTRARVMNGNGRTLWEQPSTFTGSFWLGAAAEGGVIVEIPSSRDQEAANLTINWREPDQEIV
ncbi:MAG TPA: hypothetical protein VNE18_12000 [Rhodanobacter sp.]|nr:hypothetical protein [Rhodanobacter sp.]